MTDPVLRALSHPTRLRMLSLMWAGPLSAANLSTELGISHGLASQHLRTLDRAGLVELAEVRANRGGRERLYRTVKGSPLSDRADASPLLTEAFVKNLRQRLTTRVPESASVVTDAELWVTPEVWTEYRKRLAVLMYELHEHSAPPHTPGTQPIGAFLMAFEMRPGTGDPT
ncbi:metalloregulator ArsR/SmtB family transcription factor [Actinophytocola sp.]|uniref:ArsR/SmtB family transcription factor n=1 Tax=Actinophytocola sp. TaxID=1872138 RepID=UPI002D7046AE|nr:metalloregulator ArsR/SmtB family transcription factor [Actinophytocola sp.]HYQ61942.1 metalloregulator ArsR/SmtB family transcription factor [Actinophytocola sp.]